MVVESHLQCVRRVVSKRSAKEASQVDAMARRATMAIVGNDMRIRINDQMVLKGADDARG